MGGQNFCGPKHVWPATFGTAPAYRRV